MATRRLVFFCSLLLLFCLVLSLGAIIGYSMASRVNVTIYDPAACSVADNLNLDLMAEWAKSDPDYVELLRQYRGLKPLVLAGPFQFYLNPSTGDFLIQRKGDLHPLVQQLREGNETELVFYGKGGHADCSFTYEKDTGKLLKSSFTSSGEGGILGSPICCYMDTTGDGRFDILLDHETGDRYEQRGLQWVNLDAGQDPGEPGRDPPPAPDKEADPSAAGTRNLESERNTRENTSFYRKPLPGGNYDLLRT